VSAREVLAAALHEATGYHSDEKWDTLSPVLRDAWLDQADVVLARMNTHTDGPAPAADPEGDPAEALRLAVEVFAAAGEAVNAAGLRGVPATDWVDAIRLLSRLRDGFTEAGFVQSSLTTHVYLTGEHGDQTIDGIGRVKIARGRGRQKWDERGTIQAVIDAKMEQRGYEVPDDPWDVVEWILESASVGYFRVTPLRALGIEPDAFCESLPGKVGVSLPPR